MFGIQHQKQIDLNIFTPQPGTNHPLFSTLLYYKILFEFSQNLQGSQNWFPSIRWDFSIEAVNLITLIILSRRDIDILHIWNPNTLNRNTTSIFLFS